MDGVSMGTSSSRNFDPDPSTTEHTFISKHSNEVIGSSDSKMATTMDTQITQQDDLGHDTLMGLQELDSHLSIFESTETGLDTSTPGAISPPGFDTAIDTIEDSNTIVVESPVEYQHSDIKPRAKPKETKPGFNIINKYVLATLILLSLT
jgi:hypothetical protein